MTAQTKFPPIRFVVPRLVPPIDYDHIYLRNMLNMAAGLGLTMCVEAPHYPNCEPLDRAHPFPVYRASMWGKLVDPNNSTLPIVKRAQWKALAIKKTRQWKSAPEKLIIFVGVDGNLPFLNAIRGKIPYALMLHYSELALYDGYLKSLKIEDFKPSPQSLQFGQQYDKVIRNAAFIFAFNLRYIGEIYEAGVLTEPPVLLPHFIDLAFFKPGVFTEGARRQYRLKGKGALTFWPTGSGESLEPFIKVWERGGEALQKRASLVVGFQSLAAAKEFEENMKEDFGWERPPSWFRLAGHVPFNHLPYYFNSASAFVYHPPLTNLPHYSLFPGWEIAAAVCCGCPVVAPKYGDHAEMLFNAKGIANSCEAPELVEKLLVEHPRLLDPADENAEQRAAAGRAAGKAFSPERFKAALSTALDKALTAVR